MKKLLVLAMALLMLAGVSACGDNNPVQGVVDSVASRLSGDVTGEVGKDYQTEWFAFRVNSLETANVYMDAAAEEGYVFLIANVYEVNNWDGEKALPMGNFDFYVLEGEGTEEVWAESPWDEAMMPDQFYLEPEEEATYDVVFQVSEDVSSVSFVYVEIDEDEGTHATFTIKHAL